MKTKKIILAAAVAMVALGAGLAIGSHFWAQPTTAAKFSLDEQSATIQAINKAMPSVVSIVVYDQEPVMDSSTGQTSQKQINKGQGTGFIISADGLILTNRHVVEAGQGDGVQYKIITNEQKVYYAKLIGKDPLNDLAVLKIDEGHLPFLEMGASTSSPIGLTVMAIGNVLGRYDNSVTKGIISGLGRKVMATDPINGGVESLDNVIQTDASINEGNSGGPLINLDGKVIGINVAVDKSGSGLGFAIPIDDAKSVIDSVRKTGQIVRSRFGVRYEMIDAVMVADQHLTKEFGALVTKDDMGNPAVVDGSPAANAGIQDGDIIFQVNDIKLDGTSSLTSVIQRYHPGDKISVKIQRGYQYLVKTVTLDQFPSQ